MSKLEMLLRDKFESELVLEHHLKGLSENLQQQLQELERRHEQELDKRIQQDAALSTHKYTDETQAQHRHTGLRKVPSTPALNSNKGIPLDQINSSVVHLACNSTGKSTESKHAKTYHCQRAFAMTWPNKEEEAMAECLKKFTAHPVPGHVSAALFREMTMKKERQRQLGLEQRKNFLLSMQKPFGFEEREREKRAKVIAMINETAKDNNEAVVVKNFHKITKGSKQANKDFHKVPKQTVEDASVSEGPKLRTAERTRKERVGFLDESPSFQPKIIRQVPDFCRLHKALQRETTQTKETTKCQPFQLRTSALPMRQSRASPQQSQAQTVSHLSRSKSLGVLTSLSTDTLPVYITDATRKRAEAIRKSMEVQENRTLESADWLRKYQMGSEAMQRTVTLQAKLLDPHRSLKEVYNEKLQHHREADQQRMREYSRELKGMRARVSQRPYLFQQVRQKSAKANAEKTYRNTLRNAGLKEQFVEENGLARLSSSPSISEGNTDASTENQHSRAAKAGSTWRTKEVSERGGLAGSGAVGSLVIGQTGGAGGERRDIPSLFSPSVACLISLVLERKQIKEGGEIGASVTDKSVAELVSLTATWAGGRERNTVSGKATATHTSTHHNNIPEPAAPEGHTGTTDHCEQRAGVHLKSILTLVAYNRMDLLSEKDKELIRGSWESLGKNKVPHGVIMFSRLFELDPELLSLFYHRTKCSSSQDCLSSPEFVEHVTKVMLVIDAAVSNLDDLPSLEDFLLNLGRKHQAVGVHTQSFAVVGEALLYMLQCSLGQAYTAPLQQAWLNMYSIVVAAMSRGWAKNGEDKAD